MKVLVTGCAGFIGFHACLKLIKNHNIIYGVDNLNNYYDPKLKKKRLSILKNKKNFKFYKIDIKNKKKVFSLFKKNNFDYIVHLAAQAGVRYSTNNPRVYLDNNINGFFNILDASRIYNVKHFIFASSSSVYGDSSKFPSKENDNTDKPLSFYSATKKSNEILAHSYSNIYKLPCTGLRFFTIYGPFGRPDMSFIKFVKAIKKSKNIYMFNGGNHVRDFTFIDDAISIVSKILKRPSKKIIPYQIFNIGSNKPVKLAIYLKTIEKVLKKKAKVSYESIQKGDVLKTHASISALYKLLKYKPKTKLINGISKFVNWFNEYYKI